MLGGCPGSRRITSLTFAICIGFNTVNADCVEFDSPPWIVATSEDLVDGSDEKLVRLHIPVSCIVPPGMDEAKLQFVFLVSSATSEPFHIVDYAPKTALTTNVEGNVTVEQKFGDATRVGLSAVLPHQLVTADASANRSSNSSDSRRWEESPTQRVLLASGTMNRSSSVYFKLNPSPQTTLEGNRVFEVTLQVPAEWRAGLVEVRCLALKQANFGVGKPEPCSRRRFIVGAHLKGDVAARNCVREYANCRQQLLWLARKNDEGVREQRYPTWAHRFGATISLTKPRIPDTWLDAVLTSLEERPFEDHLPKDIHRAAHQFREAKRAVLECAG